MKIVIDMNLSPSWVDVFERAGWTAIHWSCVADPRAPDRVIMDWARANQHFVFTNDLDFGTLLAMTGAAGPSVVQVRGFRLAPRDLGDLVVRALRLNQAQLLEGALIVVNEANVRVRILPLRLGK